MRLPSAGSAGSGSVNREREKARLASPLSFVTITSGTNSSNSAGRSVGRLPISAAFTLPWLAAFELPRALS